MDHLRSRHQQRGRVVLYQECDVPPARVVCPAEPRSVPSFFFFFFLFLFLFLTRAAVIETFPFEVSETGWGEFEVGIKITFHDPAEKPVSVYHHLRLYPSAETTLRDKAVVCEKYDEIVRPPARQSAAAHALVQIFNEPTEMTRDLLTKSRHLSIPSKKSEAFLYRATSSRATIGLTSLPTHFPQTLKSKRPNSKRSAKRTARCAVSSSRTASACRPPRPKATPSSAR